MNSSVRTKSCRMGRGSRGAAIVLVAGSALMLLPAPAFADDPCSDTDSHVSKATQSLQRYNNLISKSAVFRVRQIDDGSQGREGDSKSEVSYEAGGKVLFGQQIVHPSAMVADHFVIKPIKSRDGAKLGLGYAWGAGGGVSCEYKILDTGGRFTARRGKW